MASKKKAKKQRPAVKATKKKAKPAAKKQRPTVKATKKKAKPAAKKKNPKRTIVGFSCTKKERDELKRRAQVYAGGNFSAFMRHAGYTCKTKMK